MCICMYILKKKKKKKLGLPGYTDSTRIVGKHATIFNIITLLSILDPEYETTVDLNDDAIQADHCSNNHWWKDWIHYHLRHQLHLWCQQKRKPA